jgi:D-alanyl-lipoteichoic acid acyltransferase DltB (MBOAT superfamily)
MNFVELRFLIFFVVFCALFFATRGRVRMAVCLLFSYYFYACWDWRFLGLIGLSTVTDFFVGRTLERTEVPGRRRALLLVSLLVNLGILLTFKYFQFFLDSTVSLLGILGFEAHRSTLGIILPVGISFYTFQTLSYVVDVYRKRLAAEPSLLNYAVFVSFFPQLVAGPIVRAKLFVPQLRAIPAFEWRRARAGMQWILWGYFLKTCVADNIAPYVDSCFLWPGASSSMTLIVGAVLFSFQLYGDFAGYSLIAIGIGHFLGFDFGMNFRRPFFATNFSDFWARWHISLSTWLRDYLFVPLGGFSRSQMRVHFALITTFFLAGLWHGANWNYVIFGLMHGVFLSVQRFATPGLERFARVRRGRGGFLWMSLSILVVFTLTTISFVFFRAASLSEAWEYLGGIASLEGLSPATIRYKFMVSKAGLMVAILLVVECVQVRYRIEGSAFFDARPGWQALSMAVLGLIIVLFGSFSGNSFIYFQF